MNGINPHDAIDSCSCYVILMKMQNKGKNDKNYLLAMYSEMSLTGNKITINKGPGFVSSITNRTRFTIKKDSQYNARFKINNFLL